MTSIETGPSWADRLNPRHWTLVWKLVIVGLVPAVLALTLGVLRITDQANSAADLSRGADLVGLHTRVANAADGLRQERDQAVLFVASNRTGNREPIVTADAHADETIGAMRTGLGGAGTLDSSTSVAVAQADGLLDQLSALRRDVTDDSVLSPSIRDRYTRVIEGVDVLDRSVLRSVQVPDTSGRIDALTALQNVTAQLAVQHTVLGAAIRAGKLQPGDADAANDANGLIFAQYRAYQVALTPDQLQSYGSFLDDPANADRQGQALKILGSADRLDPGVDAGSWDSAYTASKAAADRSAELIRQDLVSASNAAAQQAGNRAGINSVILLLGLLIGITIAVLVARSLIRSLRVLRGAALDVAERRLPNAVERMRAGESPDVAVEPVPIRSRDEVGQVARAFDAVHGQAIKLAADQAALQTNVSAMFVNLSRRSQALVERQLQLIEALESNEQDADQLSNLFQLDHLATRMRRNSENLLVLAGTDLAKRNASPVPMVDVLRAAVSEVEQYQRVVVQAPPAASIAGRAGSDLVHLLAELLDNATNFSPPDSQVVMSATRTPDGSMVVEISDRGVGMADHDLADANERLGGPADVDVSASRRMGLFVVGRLAARHGIAVRLSSAAAGPGSGLTAWVSVPGSLIPTGMPLEPARPVGVPMAAGSRPGGPGDDARAPRSDVNGARTDSPAAQATGPDGAPSTVQAPGESFAAGDQGTLFSGQPPVNGNVANGLPTRQPGSSLRPEVPPPTSAPPGGFFDEGTGRGAEPRERPRAPGEQARLDQEAAARRDRMAGTAGAPSTGKRPPSEDERPLPDDERSVRPDDAPVDDTGARLSDDLTDPGSASPTERPVGGPPAGAPAPGTRKPNPAAGARPTGAPGQGESPFGSPAPGASDLPRRAPRPVDPDRPADRRGGDRTADPRGGERTGVNDPAAFRAPPGAPAPGAPAPGASSPFTPRPFEERGGQRPGEEPTPPRGGPEQSLWTEEPTVADPVSPERADRPTNGPFRTDQQQQQQRGQQPSRSSGWPTPDVTPPAGGPVEPPADQDQDELFAPRVPSLDPDGVLPGHDTGDTAFDRGETTPIFEEIASAWFRSNRPVPVSWESDTGPHPLATAGPAAADVHDGSGDRAAEGPARTAPAAGWGIGDPAPDPRSVAPDPAAAPAASSPGSPSVTAEPQVPAARSTLDAPSGDEAAVPAARTPAADFASAADEGWLAASSVTERSDELTSAGLPKRRPRARLIPGSAGSAVLAPPVTSARSAETIRGRLASYQQGVRQGRETRLRGLDPAEQPAPPAPADADHDEESS